MHNESSVCVCIKTFMVFASLVLKFPLPAACSGWLPGVLAVPFRISNTKAPPSGEMFLFLLNKIRKLHKMNNAVRKIAV